MRVNLPSRTATIVSAARHLSGEGVSPIGGDVDGLAPLLSPPHAAGWLSRIARMTRSEGMRPRRMSSFAQRTMPCSL